MNPHEPQFAWLLWSLFLVCIWVIIYLLLKKREARREMLIVSLWTSLLWLTEPLFLSLATSLNPIYTSAIALILGGFATWYCRPDLKKKMIVSAFLFLGLYFMYFLTLIAMYPGYVEKVWQLYSISGILVAGIPLEELMFALSFGFFWSSIYEHLTWRKLKSIS